METLTTIAMISLPVGMATQAYVSRFFGESKAGIPPLVIFLTGWKVRLANGLLLMLLILSLSTATEGGGAIPLWVYGFGVGVTVLSSIASSAMFVAQMAFFNRVSDPKIGGTYMTMLNTISNLGGQWPPSAMLFLKGQLEEAGVQDSFYILTGVSLAVGAVWLLLFSELTLGLQRKPRESWRAVHDE